MIKLLKKAVKWYLENSDNPYVWTPSGMIPYVQPKVEPKKAA